MIYTEEDRNQPIFHGGEVMPTVWVYIKPIISFIIPFLLGMTLQWYLS